MKAKFTKALVTGASSGIGEELALQLAARGVSLLLAGRDRARLEAVRAEIGVQVPVQILIGDLSEASDRSLLVDLIHREAPDLVINNAGFGFYGEALSYETAPQLDMVEINCKALLECTLEAARTLAALGRPGTIVNISSVAATPVMPYFSVYAATKAFVSHLSESLDFELRPRGIRVLTSCPGVVLTRFQERASGSKSRKNLGGAKPMTVKFAATEILTQIDQGERTRAFDWRYRLADFFCRYIAPKSMVAALVSRDLLSRTEQRPLIPPKTPYNETT